MNLKLTQRSRQRQRGVSVLVIMALLACMAILIASNSSTLAVLKQELNAIDQRQQQRYEQSADH